MAVGWASHAIPSGAACLVEGFFSSGLAAGGRLNSPATTLSRRDPCRDTALDTILDPAGAKAGGEKRTRWSLPAHVTSCGLLPRLRAPVGELRLLLLPLAGATGSPRICLSTRSSASFS